MRTKNKKFLKQYTGHSKNYKAPRERFVKRKREISLNL